MTQYKEQESPHSEEAGVVGGSNNQWTFTQEMEFETESWYWPVFNSCPKLRNVLDLRHISNTSYVKYVT